MLGGLLCPSSGIFSQNGLYLAHLCSAVTLSWALGSWKKVKVKFIVSYPNSLHCGLYAGSSMGFSRQVLGGLHFFSGGSLFRDWLKVSANMTNASTSGLKPATTEHPSRRKKTKWRNSRQPGPNLPNLMQIITHANICIQIQKECIQENHII